MKLLLDTHVLLWALGAPHRLRATLLADLRDTKNEVLFSAVNIWEVAIKAGQGRPTFANNAELVAQEARDAGFVDLPVTARHAAAVQTLPPLHGDPFDRLLIAQALCEPAHLVTADRQMARYAVLLRQFNPNPP